MKQNEILTHSTKTNSEIHRKFIIPVGNYIDGEPWIGENNNDKDVDIK